MHPRKRTIGVIDHTWDEAHLFYARLATGLCAKEHGYELITAKVADFLPLDDLAGLIYRRRTLEDDPSLNILRDLGVPLVVLNSPSDAIPTVNSDFTRGTVEAVGHLKEIGRSRIAYVAARPDIYTAPDRLNAFVDAMRINDIPFDRGLLVEADFGYDKARSEVFELLRRESNVDAIICCSDRAAMGAIHAAKQRGSKVPDDIAVIGCGNMPEVLLLGDHALTTIADPLYFAAYKAAKKLIRRIETRDVLPTVETVSTRLVKRQSTLGRDYADPLQETSFVPGVRGLDYILSVGGSLDEAARLSIQQLFSRLQQEGVSLFDSFKEVLIKAVSLGYDASLAHYLITRLGDRLGHWNRDRNAVPFGSIEMNEAIFEVCCNEVTRYGRYSKAMLSEMDEVIRSLQARQESSLSIGGFLETLSGLARGLECRFVGFFKFEEAVRDATLINESKGIYWLIDERGLRDSFATSWRRLNPLDELRSEEYKNVATDLMSLEIEGRISAIVLFDLDTKFGPFMKRLKPLLEERLHRIHLFSSWERNRQELNRQKLIAERASNAKSEFLALVSHELRTPLNCIMGMTELALKTELDDQQESFLKLVFQASKDQLSLVNDILNFSKIESGGLEIKSEVIDTADMIRHISDLVRIRALDKGLDFGVEVADGLPELIIGDRSCITQIVRNVLENAIKFTGEGRVDLTAGVNETALGVCSLAISVKDTGCGIPAEKLSSIFRAFEQLDSGTTRSSDGVGLGLAIVKKSLDLLGGRIEVESEFGVGSCFRIEVPVKLGRGGKRPHDAGICGAVCKTDDYSKLTILVVDDNESNQAVSKSILRMEGHEVEVVGSGEHALKVWDKGTFDAILMDVGMPGMSGQEVARRIRALEESEGKNCRMPIIAVTAHVQEGDRKACMDCGMDGFVSKPISRESLLDSLDSVCRRGV
ncbi:MAG: response regulator [Verrucomicrobiota bacterium]